MGIGLLGPLEIDGREAALAPRDRAVLEALALRPGSVVGAETLAAALWPTDARPASWPKVVQGCIVRLRKRLGPDRIETLPHGYRLVLAIDEIDHQRFERLVQRVGEPLALGEADRAAYLADEALGLWRGDPLLDLEEWEAGRLEQDRLTQLRRDAGELRVKAEILCGRHVQVLSRPPRARWRSWTSAPKRGSTPPAASPGATSSPRSSGRSTCRTGRSARPARAGSRPRRRSGGRRSSRK